MGRFMVKDVFLLINNPSFFFFCFYFSFIDRSNGTSHNNNNNNNNHNNTFSYEFHGDPRATFEQFFGSSNPFSSFFDHSDNIFDHNNLFNSMGGIDDDFFGSPFGLGRTPHGLGGAFR